MPNQGRMSLMTDKLTYDAAKKKDKNIGDSKAEVQEANLLVESSWTMSTSTNIARTRPQ
jgi:hypothetical protein